MSDIQEQILNWAKREDAIRALILIGSRAAHVADKYSDYDISIFCTGYKPYADSEEWLSQIGRVWICVSDTVYRVNQEFPTRLVIFEGCIKVDFSLFSLNVLHDIVSRRPLPAEYDLGYQVLLDKDELTLSLPKPSFKSESFKKPTEQEFLRIVNEFWFEAYHVAVYLKREDLWLAKCRAAQVNDFLLKMIEWHTQITRNLENSVPHSGKRMRSWVEESTWKALYQVFAHFDTSDSFKALNSATALFRQLATETANQLQYNYLTNVDKNITGYIACLRTPL
jgi:aminoglycoside 6-adenylyltransferase